VNKLSRILITRNENGKTPITRQGVTILRPGECKALIEAIPKQDYKTIFRALLFSGMRYIEMQRFQKHPNWFDSEFINLPKESVHKQLRTQMERAVRLNPIGRMTIEHFLQLKTVMPSYQSWNANLACWAFHAKLHGSESLLKKKANGSEVTEFRCKGLSCKSTRKTYESWLVYYYPNRITEILLSQGHNQITSIQHYLNMPFNEHDKIDMKEFVDGWIN
jgi:hypothetical protein